MKSILLKFLSCFLLNLSSLSSIIVYYQTYLKDKSETIYVKLFFGITKQGLSILVRILEYCLEYFLIYPSVPTHIAS